MATETAAASNAGSKTPAEESVSAPRLLWQAPIFVAGVALLAYVVATRLAESPGAARQLDCDLHEARENLDHPDGNLEVALAACERAVASATPAKRGEALFLLGSAHLFLAGKASGDSATDHYQLARKFLEAGEHQGVPEADGGKVNYRLGKAGYYTADDRQRVAQRLLRAIEFADDRAEAYFLLCQTYLQLPQPDLAAALRANEQLRQVPRAGEEVLSSARLQGGEILLRMGKPEEARKVLEKVGPEAPPAVLVRSRILQARTFQDESRWAEAAKFWQVALADGREPPAEQALLRYNLGLCLAKTDHFKEAVQAWEECRRNSKGDEAAAAALALAALDLGGGEPEKALPCLTAAVEAVSGPNEWKNGLVNLEHARQVFEKAVDVYRKAARTDLALQAAGIYERLAAPGRAQTLQAVSAGEGARARQELARTAPEGEKVKLAEEARALYAEAAEAYTRVADAMGRTAEAADYLWSATARALDAQDQAQAARLLERFLPANQKPERMSEGWYRLGEARRLQGKESAALEAYRECIKHGTAFAYRARYQLALFAIKNGEQDEAQDALELNLRNLRFDPDKEAQEKSLFALGNLHYQKRNYSKAAARLEEALAHFPANTEATRAHFQLAESYYLLGAQENQRLIAKEFKTEETEQHARREYRRWQQKAVEEYLELAKLLETPVGAGRLTADEAIQVPFMTAECKFNLGNYEDALQIYEAVAAKNKGLNHLNALGGLVRCHSARGEMDKMRQRLDEIRTVLATMDDGIKAQWKDWLTTASKPLIKP